MYSDNTSDKTFRIAISYNSPLTVVKRAEYNHTLSATSVKQYLFLFLLKLGQALKNHLKCKDLESGLFPENTAILIKDNSREYV